MDSVNQVQIHAIALGHSMILSVLSLDMAKQ